MKKEWNVLGEVPLNQGARKDGKSTKEMGGKRIDPGEV